MKHMDIDEFNAWAKEHIVDENKFDEDGCIIMENDKNYKSTGIIAQIFEDNWDDFYYSHKTKIDFIRPNADKEVHKVIDCFNHNLGASIYVCPNDDEIFYCHHTCKSKLCSSCGIKAQKIKVENILEKCIHGKYRHITFTIPKDLVKWFINNLSTCNIIFDAVCDTIYSVINGKVPKKKIRKYGLKYMPGFFAFLHTFGRPLNFNPHIHVVLAELGLTKDGIFKKINYLNYDALSKRFMMFLLDKMEKYFGKKNFRETKNKMYLKYPNGFYVNNKLEDDGYKFNNITDLISYVTRYCSRPVIAESRITNYDGNTVTWHYIDHHDDSFHEITDFVFDFIGKLLTHLLPSNFKSIRYYGFFNKNDKINDECVNKIIKKGLISFKRSLIKWSNSILTSYHRIPIKCPKCGRLMEYCFEVS